MDRTLLDLVSLFLSFAGLFAAVVEFKSPHMRKTFWGSNPFATKHFAIQAFAVSSFLGLSALGALVQVYTKVDANDLPDRVHASAYYAVFSTMGILLTVALVFIIGWASRRLARSRWLPEVIPPKKEFADRAWFASRHDWLNETNYLERDKVSKDSLATAARTARESIERELPIVEDLLDLSHRGSLPARIARLRRFVDDHLPAAERRLELTGPVQ